MGSALDRFRGLVPDAEPHTRTPVFFHGTWIDIPVVAGGALDPLALGPPQPAATTCTLNGDVTGNNFHGNWACFDTGIQFGNPMQYGGHYSDGSNVGPGIQLFAGNGPPPPQQYGVLNGVPNNQPNTYPFIPGSAWYFDTLNGHILRLNSAGSWVQLV